MRRIDLAVRAFGEELAPSIIASGGRRWGNHVEAVVIKRELVARGVPSEAVAMELCSLSTAENCLFTAELLGPTSHRVILATCAWHMRRASRNFGLLGINASAPPSAWFTTPPPTLTRRIRERVNTVVDWCMMPRARHA
jgi:uncharacterized SAM-binding protein YcdF (DUF218 family)